MSNRARYEDITAVLYLVPFIGGVAYAAVLWAQSGASYFLPNAVYLTVTRDPILFIVASLAVLAGLVIEVNTTEPSARSAKLLSLGSTLQSIAIASLVIVLLSDWYANGFTDLGGAGADFIVGRYGIVFPAVMVLLSYLLTARFRVQALTNRSVLGLVALLLVPVSVYELGKRIIVLGLVTALVLLALGLFLLLYKGREQKPQKEE